MKNAMLLKNKLTYISLFFFTVLFASTTWAAAPIKTQVNITGQVVDTSGLPIQGVIVSTITRGIAAVQTNSGGVFTLTGMKKKARIVINFAKQGYTSVQKSAVVSGTSAFLSVAMLKSGINQTLNTATGGELREAGFKVIFPPNSFNVIGDINVAITPIDVSTNQLKGAPGDFSATTATGQAVTLESFSMADFNLTQNGAKVNLKAGSTAQIELLLPANSFLTVGTVKPLWYFDPVTALWKEEGTGVVQASSTTPGRLAVVGTVSHFTWWNVDQPMVSTAVSGRVVDKNGLPIADATVVSSGYDYFGTSQTVTDANGNYCLTVRTNSLFNVTASTIVNGIYLSASTAILPSDGTISNCSTGPTQTMSDIPIATGFSCVNGDVRDINDNPVSGVLVTSSSGGFATTDINGFYQITAPETANVAVSTEGYPVKRVDTPVSGEPCGVANIRPSTGGATSCITGFVKCNSANGPGLPNHTVKAGTTNGADDLGSAGTDASGRYCITNLVPNSTIPFLSITSAFYNTFSTVEGVSTGAGGGTCLPIPPDTPCNTGPDIIMSCSPPT